MTAVMTLWFCLASQPNCAMADDPTGPGPVVIDRYPDMAACLARTAQITKILGPPRADLVVRYTCKPEDVGS